MPVAVGTSSNPIVINNGDHPSFSNQTHVPPSLVPTTLPSMNMNYTQFIRELREAVKNWEVKVPPNSYVDHPSNHFRVHKDNKGDTHIVIPSHGKTQVIDLDQFCDWIRRRNVATSVPLAISANSQAGSFSSVSNAQKAIPSTARKANVQTTSSISQFQSATPHPQPGASSSKQTQPTMSSMHNQGTALSTSRQTVLSTSQFPLSTPLISVPQLGPSSTVQTPSSVSVSKAPTRQLSTRQTGSSTSQIPLSTPSIFAPQLGPSSTAQTPSSVSVPKRPSRQLSTIVNGVPRSAKQADKKSLASHILFGLGKRPRESDASRTALIEPQPKRRAQQATGQVEEGISPSASYTIGQAQFIQKPNVPVQLHITPSTVSSLQQPSQHVFTPTTIAQHTQQISQTFSGDQQQFIDTALEIPSASNIASAVEVPEASESFSDQMPLSLQNTSNAPLSVLQPNSQQEIISDDRLATSSVPLATSPTVFQTSTLPLPVPSVVPVAVSSEFSSGVNENTTHTALKRAQPNTLAKPQHSFTGILMPGGSGTSAQTPQKYQPLFLPSPVSSPGVEANDSTSGRQSVDMVSRSFDLRKSSSSAKRKNYAYVLAPPRPQYLVEYLQLKMSRASLKKRMTSRSSVSTSVAGEEGV